MNLTLWVRQYLEKLDGKRDPKADAAELVRLSMAAGGDSRGWKFNRQEIHDRR